MESMMTQGKGVNSDEARGKAYLCFADKNVDEELQLIFDDPKIATSTNRFWIFSAALKKFHAETGTTPVSGTI